MGDSETVVAQTSSLMDYTSVGYTSTSYATSDVVPDASGAAGDMAPVATADAAAHLATDGSSLGDGSTYTTDANSAAQEAPDSTSCETTPSVVTKNTGGNSTSHEITATGSSQPDVYDTSMNGNSVSEASNVMAAVTNENGNASEDAGGTGIEQHYVEGSVPAMSMEEDRLWSIVRANSLDFNAWTALIEETEKVAEDNILKIRKVYDAFLAEFPLCYGYWKKYADHEARFGSIDKVIEVYERAVLGVTYSVDIWLHYCIFAISTFGDPETIRRLFERGLAYVGTDYLSFPLWDKYIEYEYTQQEWCRLAVIYTRILEHPNQQLDRYFNSFKELAASRPLSELRTAEEAAAASSFPQRDILGGEGNPGASEQSSNPVSAGLTDAEELEKYIAIREDMYKKAKEFDSKIIGFETAIRRPYFHVRPLNPSELENWHNYLDFIERSDDFNKLKVISAASYAFWLNRWTKELFKREIELRLKHGSSIWYHLIFLTIYLSGKEVPPFVIEGPLCSGNGVFLMHFSFCLISFLKFIWRFSTLFYLINGVLYVNQIVKLYERCLIACANYPEYWIRYVLCMEASGSMDIANNALARATQVFVKRQPEIHLFAARFKEQYGDISGARAAYQLVHAEISPGLVEAIIKHANMEHRQGKLEDAFSVYDQAIAIEKGKEHSQTLPLLFAQYSRFLYLVCGNAEKAREMLVEALEHVQLSKPLLEALIHLETISSLPKRIDHLDLLVDKFIVPNPDNPNVATTADREELSCIFLEFLDLFGDAQTIKKADDRHAKLFLPHRSTSELKKRHAEDFLTSDKAKLAKSYSGVTSPAQSLMGAYPTAQNQWAAGYGAQPQAWPQVTQAQGQQWNLGYTQQVGDFGFHLIRWGPHECGSWCKLLRCSLNTVLHLWSKSAEAFHHITAAYNAYGGYGSSYTHSQVPASVQQTAAAYGAYPPTFPAQAFPQQSYAQPTAAAATALAPAQQSASVPQAYYGTYY
ncbi:hypothetical protein RJ641_031231 [Dillenia turbinata]|uniref:Pre-mRNA-processing factor 39 n=1 Tax=Dillenia turbinata TaxID=194707 RepID=A0AAN8W0L1_9MAGN